MTLMNHENEQAEAPRLPCMCPADGDPEWDWQPRTGGFGKEGCDNTTGRQKAGSWNRINSLSCVKHRLTSRGRSTLLSNIKSPLLIVAIPAFYTGSWGDTCPVIWQTDETESFLASLYQAKTKTRYSWIHSCSLRLPVVPQDSLQIERVSTADPGYMCWVREDDEVWSGM